MNNTIFFKLWGNYGRLGNQIFQWLSMLGISESYNKKLIMPRWRYSEYFDTPPDQIDELPNVESIKEAAYHYDPKWLSPLNRDGNFDITGWLQSTKYFKRERLSDLKFKPSSIDCLLKKIPELSDRPLAISVRRGDMVNNQRYSLPGPEYYVSALLTHFNPHREIIIFSDDIPYCKIHFECLPNVTFAEGLSDIEQLCAMSLCGDFILSNSTFSYCGALLADRGKVIRPRYIFSESYRAKNSEQDYWPTKEWLGGREWIIHDPCKIDLMDTTFTIPVLHDHNDRRQNLNLSLCLLQRQFNTNFIIGEQGTRQFGYTAQWANYRWFDLKHFHRTKMLNDMAKESTTPYVYNWDCDNITPMLQVWLAVDKLRKGEADMVYPFDGRVARMKRDDWFRKMEKSLDVGITAGCQWQGRFNREPIVSSVGHAVVVNKIKFLESGGENEYFISYGPEDCERYDRWNKLGFRVGRIRGIMYHMDHYCGSDSSVKNPYFNANKDELMKEREMSVEEMWKYVKGFPWRHKYDENYYATIETGARISAEVVYRALSDIINPMKMIVDLGAGIGEWAHGDYTGIDFNSPNTSIHQHDLRQPYRSQRRYDLALCLEVAEHLPLESAGVLVESLCQLAPFVLFSAAIPFQGGEDHQNERWPSWWAKLFERFGYYPHPVDIRESVWNNNNVEVWYRQNMVLYWKGTAGTYPLNRVHPVMWENHKRIAV